MLPARHNSPLWSLKPWNICNPRKQRMSFLIYAVGLIIVLAGLVYGASLLGVSHAWILAGALVVLGIGIAAGVGKTRQKDPSPPPQ
jgi:hypothetical protein